MGDVMHVARSAGPTDYVLATGADYRLHGGALAQLMLRSGFAAAGWNYDAMIAKLRRGEYAAIISDDTQLEPRAYADAFCSLHILQETVEPFDLAFAFRSDFANDAMRQAVSSVLLDMQEDKSLEVRPHIATAPATPVVPPN